MECQFPDFTEVKFSIPIYGVQKLPMYRMLLNSNPSPEAEITLAPGSCKLEMISPCLFISRIMECLGIKMSKTLSGVS